MKSTKISFPYGIMYLFVTILIIQFVKKVDISTARKLLFDYIKECLFPSTNLPGIAYPVYIGIDDWYYPHADIIEKEFDELKTTFTNFYFYNCSNNGDTLSYQFQAGTPHNVISDYDLNQYCKFNTF